MDANPQINISRVQVAGVGGFGLVVVAFSMAFDLPAVRIFCIAATSGGLLAAVALFLYRRWVGDAKGPSGPQSIFMLDDEVPDRKGRATAPLNRTLKAMGI